MHTKHECIHICQCICPSVSLCIPVCLPIMGKHTSSFHSPFRPFWNWTILKRDHSWTRPLSNETLPKWVHTKMVPFPEDNILKRDHSQMRSFSSKTILKWDHTEMIPFPDDTILKWDHPKMVPFPDDTILKWDHSKVLYTSDLIWELSPSLELWTEFVCPFRQSFTNSWTVKDTSWLKTGRGII